MKLLFESWRGFVNEKLLLKPGVQGWDLYSRLVGEAYMEAPLADPSAEGSYLALAEFVNKFFERIVGVVDVEFVDYHPYTSSRQLIKQVKEEGILLVSTADAEHPIFDAETNAKFRAVHDFGGHVQRKVPFSLTGELKAYNSHVKMVPSAAVPALFSEVVGQICCFYLNNKTNCPQKMVILDQFDFVNVGVVKGYNIVNKELVKESRQLFKKVKQIPYKFDWGLLNEEDRPPDIATFDFDDTLKSTDTKTATPLVQATKDLAAKGATVYIVSSRQNTWENMLEITQFIKDNDLPIAASPLNDQGVHLTNFDDKLDTLIKLGSEMHFDDDPQELQAIEKSDAQIKMIKINPSTGTVDLDWKPDEDTN